MWKIIVLTALLLPTVLLASVTETAIPSTTEAIWQPPIVPWRMETLVLRFFFTRKQLREIPTLRLPSLEGL